MLKEKTCIFKTIQSDLLKYDGQKAEVLRELTETEADIDEAGKMYEIQMEDGSVLHAFEDELRPRLNEDEMLQLIEAYNSLCSGCENGPILHWTDVEGHNREVCVVERPRFCEYKVYATEAEDISLMFENEFVGDALSPEEWRFYVKETFEKAGIDAGLIAKYEEYIFPKESISSKEVPHEPGVCPICGGVSLEYSARDFRDDCVAYPWSCNDCGAHGEEFYNLEFVEHIVED